MFLDMFKQASTLPFGGILNQGISDLVGSINPLLKQTGENAGKSIINRIKHQARDHGITGQQANTFSKFAPKFNLPSTSGNL
jgi:hypothetical protein